MKELEKKHGRSNASLVMHTDPGDDEGPNLLAAVEHLGIKDSVVFSNQRVEFEQMNILHNISDVCINLAYAEGFGLATLEAMQCGNPIIAVKTGGLTRQVVDHRDGSQNGVALDVDFQSLVGSQGVPYIYEDYCDVSKAAGALMKLYEMPSEDRKKLSKKVQDYVSSEFGHQQTVDAWHEKLTTLIESWKEKRPQRWSCTEMRS
jgi:glycosyltransferase involved in cell wall biosynthesis